MIHSNGIFTEKWTAKIILVHFMRGNIVNRNEVQVENCIPWVIGKIFSLLKKILNLIFQVQGGVFSEEGISDIELLAENLWKKSKYSIIPLKQLPYLFILLLLSTWKACFYQITSSPSAFHEMLPGHNFLIVSSLICIQVCSSAPNSWKGVMFC